MGERKVLNKYFPPDFDPSLVPRRKRPKNEQIEVRMMLPFSLQCGTCGEYMYRGKKFNSRKEEVVEETYHGIRIFRFYIKCIVCSSEITFKTDPKHQDYVAEHGCVRNFEPWRESEADEDAAHQEREDEERGDAMKALENRTLESKREMDILDALDEIKAINQRHAKIDTDALLQQHAANSKTDSDSMEVTKEQLAQQLDADLQQAKRAFEARGVKRKVSDSVERATIVTSSAMATNAAATALLAPAGDKRVETPTTALAPVVVVKKKKTTVVTAGAKTKPKKKKAPVQAVTSLVAQYSDSE